MSAVIGWMAAEGEDSGQGPVAGGQSATLVDESREPSPPFENREGWGSRPAGFSAQGLPVHQFPAHQFTSGKVEAGEAEDLPGENEGSQVSQDRRDPSTLLRADVGYATDSLEDRQDLESERERRVYRGRTVAMLRRYMRYAIETGRLPSLLGREFFRAKVTSYTVVTFEDRVIFVHDMERCLEELDEFSRQLIARHILQEHDQQATARLLHCGERTVRRLVPQVLDQLSEILLELGLMDRLSASGKNSCQGGLEDEIFVSAWEEDKYKF
jgi:hypothetical protein